MLSTVKQTFVVYIYLKKYYVANLGQLSHATFFAIFKTKKLRYWVKPQNQNICKNMLAVFCI